MTTSLELRNDELLFRFDLSPQGEHCLVDLRKNEVYSAPAFGVVRAWDRTEDRMRVEVLVPDAEKQKVIEIERSSDTRAVLRISLGGEGAASAMGAIRLGVAFDVVLELCGASLQLTIPEASFRERRADRYKVFSIELLPNLGATPRGACGYLVIPCQSGGLYYFDREHPKANRRYLDPAALSDDSEEGLRHRWAYNPDAPATYGSLVYGAQSQWEDLIAVPIYATVRREAGLMGLITGGAYDAELIAKRDQGPQRWASIHPRFHYRYFWHSKRDIESRCLRLIALRDAEACYGGVANTYRKYLIEEAGIKTLRQRADANPAIDYFLRSCNVRIMFGMTHGGTAVCYQSFAQLAESVPWFKQAGFDKVSFTGVGANLGGHDWAHPTIFPFEPNYGGEEEMKKLIAAVYAHGYTFGLHNNYKDVYRHSEDWREDAIQVNEWGELRYHGAWMGGYSYQGLPHKMLEYYARRDFPKLRELGMRGYWYCDAIGGVMEESFPPHDPICRREYGEGMNAYLQLAADTFGCVGNEVPIAPSLGVIVSTNILGFSGDSPVDPMQNGYARNGLLDHMVPLLHMVFHGICSYPGSAEIGGRVGMEYNKQPTREEIADLYARFAQWMEWGEELQYAFFTAHEEVAPGVWRSAFSDGTQILVNKTNCDITIDGKTVPAKGQLTIKAA